MVASSEAVMVTDAAAAMLAPVVNVGCVLPRLQHPLVRARGRGMFAVRRGDGWLSGALAWLLRLPRAAAACEATLEVAPRGGASIWRRTFGGTTLVTAQRPGPGGVLLERFGPVELSFRFVVEGGWLVFAQVGCVLALGPLRASLPRMVAPRVDGRARPAAEPDAIEAAVAVYAPVLGLLVAYEGTMTIGFDSAPPDRHVAALSGG